jgi:hypothetical protein
MNALMNNQPVPLSKRVNLATRRAYDEAFAAYKRINSQVRALRLIRMHGYQYERFFRRCLQLKHLFFAHNDSFLLISLL